MIVGRIETNTLHTNNRLLETGGLDTLLGLDISEKITRSTRPAELLDHRGAQMAFFDLSLNELKTYCPGRDEPEDFDPFWTFTLDEARAFPLSASFEKMDFGLVAQETFDVTFNGFG